MNSLLKWVLMKMAGIYEKMRRHYYRVFSEKRRNDFFFKNSGINLSGRAPIESVRNFL